MWRGFPVLALSAGLAACTPLDQAGSPAGERAAAGSPPELTLNLPRSQAGDCECPGAAGARNTTLFDRGLVALAAGHVEEATEHFRRYRRLETTAIAQWEADVALTWASVLADRRSLDRAALAAGLQRLQPPPAGDTRPHATAHLMHAALQALAAMHGQLADLEQRNANLEDDLEKREEAIKRLRELTLGPSREVRP